MTREELEGELIKKTAKLHDLSLGGTECFEAMSALSDEIKELLVGKSEQPALRLVSNNGW
jgi:hypothetical protein